MELTKKERATLVKAAAKGVVECADNARWAADDQGSESWMSEAIARLERAIELARGE